MKFFILDLFSGIGGFSLAFENAGKRVGVEANTVAFCESDKKARLVLEKHWSKTPIYLDVRDLNFERLKKDGIITKGESGEPARAIDLVCGGFP